MISQDHRSLSLLHLYLSFTCLFCHSSAWLYSYACSRFFCFSPSLSCYPPSFPVCVSVVFRCVRSFLCNWEEPPPVCLRLRRGQTGATSSSHDLFHHFSSVHFRISLYFIWFKHALTVFSSPPVFNYSYTLWEKKRCTISGRPTDPHQE